MCAESEIYLTFREIFEASLYLFRTSETAEHFDTHRKRLEPFFECLKMLETKHGGRRKDGNLFAVAQRFKGRAHDDFGFAVTYVAAKQAVHRLRAFHIALDVRDRRLLIAGFSKLERIFKLTLPVTVSGKGKTHGE